MQDVALRLLERNCRPRRSIGGFVRLIARQVCAEWHRCRCRGPSLLGFEDVVTVDWQPTRPEHSLQADVQLDDTIRMLGSALPGFLTRLAREILENRPRSVRELAARLGCGPKDVRRGIRALAVRARRVRNM